MKSNIKYFQKFAICLHAPVRMIQNINTRQGMLKESVCDVVTYDPPRGPQWTDYLLPKQLSLAQ